MKKKTNYLINIWNHEAAPGLLLVAAMIAALIVANTNGAWYDSLLNTYAVVAIGEWEIAKPVLLWINDGLMALFFLLVGLELKREILYGELSDKRKIVLPVFAAIGGIAVPSGIYAIINAGDPEALNGWAIPAATDIAFALGILAILGSRAPLALKVFLTSVAVLDDLAAIVIIAVFYTNQLSLLSLGFAVFFLLVLFAMNRSGVKSLSLYTVVGMMLWVSVLKSGVHATLAGVAIAAFIPASHPKTNQHSPLANLEHGIHPWVAFAILPLFAFANAGVPVLGLSASALFEPVPLGIALGLFVGKQLGVFSGCLLAVRSGLAKLPSGVSWIQIYGVSALCGIGFTMSLFIGSLAFEGSGGPHYAINDRLGILTGSFLSACLGVVVLFLAAEKRVKATEIKSENLKTPTCNAPVH